MALRGDLNREEGIQLGFLIDNLSAGGGQTGGMSLACLPHIYLLRANSACLGLRILSQKMATYSAWILASLGSIYIQNPRG